MSERRVGKRGEQKRRWDEKQRGAASCVDCGAPILKRAGVKRCVSCGHEQKRVRWPEIERRWKAGETLKEIADAIGTTKDSLGATMFLMRARGWDLPYRYAKRRARA